MLDYLINKYRDKDVEQVVYRLSYAGKFIIVKGRTLCGSLIIIHNAFDQFKNKAPFESRLDHKKRWKIHSYRHLFNHFLYHKEQPYRFRIRTLAKVGAKCDQYQLLKREQMELDRSRYDKTCVNNATEAYIPIYNDLTGMYGWLEKSAVMNFKRYLGSKERQAYIKRYSKKPEPKPARNDP